MDLLNRLKTNPKLTAESVVVISAEIVKLVSYWLMIWADTLSIWKFFEDYLKGFKKKLWK
ncbi:MAG: hypothetical protein WC307_04995 [Candidatus Nanoarchaeia archaeon]|jgi:hypothetical protein